MKDSHSESYASAGVDVTAGYDAVSRITSQVESTYTPGVLGTLGGFGGLFAPDLTGVEQPVLVSATDGVGTKLRLAFLLDRHDTVGIDCVAMCVNDVICSGALPLFFLDYLAVGKNRPERVEAVVSGIAEGCRQSGCALIGGETAEMPGFYGPDEYDLAGFTVGLADRDKMIDASALAEGDVLLGLASSGVHSNGFSLIRKIFDIDSKGVQALNARYPELEDTLGETLLRPTRIYVNAVRTLLREGIRVKGASHITGGGLYENVPRMLRDDLDARIYKDSFPVPPVFRLIAREGNIPERDMYNTFNMGIGLVLAVSETDAERAAGLLSDIGEQVFRIGSLVPGSGGVELV
ncbi:MAG: phosphoribosylformylglycinamidine cyclo-ligase [Oscillospiraceae bacterium]|nr:phosphoribosylformylglycinamidine cyclo-ligase [Oscillospiraceae bacterium]